MDYFDKHLFSKPQLPLPAKRPGLIITIPCYNETGLLRVLDSIECCDAPGCPVEVIVHVNASDDSPPEVHQQNLKSVAEFLDWNRGKKYSYHLLHSPNLPPRHAGVGLARKVAMDEAAFRFHGTEQTTQLKNNPGVIVCLDADCILDKNYLVEIEHVFQNDPRLVGCSIRFEHPLEGNEYDSGIYDSIINYELFLRYYILSLKWCGFPYPYHTIGSSMAVRSDAYMKLGGMNRRKAGEDFYFLHKLFSLGKFAALNTTRVIPSPRLSDRVPFGTGADMAKQQMKIGEPYLTYNFQSFQELKQLFGMLQQLYSGRFNSIDLPPAIRSYLESEDYLVHLEEIRKHTSTEASFTKRFFRWFEGFRVLKFVHYARDRFHPNEEVSESVSRMLNARQNEGKPSGKREQLLLLRELEAGNLRAKLG